MKLITNRIVNPTGEGPTFQQWLERYAAELKQKKEASEEAKPGLGMPDGGDDPRGQARGQVVNTEGEEAMTNDPELPTEDDIKARPDTGGTTDQKSAETESEQKTAEVKKEAECGKEMGESDDAGKVTEDHTEAGPGDDEHPEPKTLINNDPNYQKGESTDPAKATGKSKKEPGDPVVGKGKGKESKVKNTFQKISSLNRLSKLKLFASLSSNKDYHLGNNPLSYVEAMVGLTFANMTEEEKRWFRDFWLTMYPPEYVEEMVADR
jgi:hypothetical protein